MDNPAANPRKVAVDSLIKMEETEGYSNLVLNGALEKSHMEQRDAALTSAIFYGVLGRRITLDYYITCHSRLSIQKLSPQILNILRAGIYQILYLEKIPVSAAVNESVKLVRRYRQNSASGFVNAVLRAVSRVNGNGIQEKDFKSRVSYLSVRYSCPEWLVTMWQNSYGTENTERMLAAFLEPPDTWIRVNSLKTTTDELLKALALQGISAEPAEGILNALTLKKAGAPEKIPAFAEGLFHVQDISSQLCCQALEAQPGHIVIDVCAAPGGKTFTLAQDMQNKGELLAFDLYESRVDMIKAGAKRLGLTCVKADVRDACNSPLKPVMADRILCDVPCSGLGVIGRKPEIRYKNPELLANLPELQYNILCIASKQLKNGGKLIYSTCSLNPAENEDVVDRFLKEHEEFEPYPLHLPDLFLRPEDRGSNQATLLPHISKTDGFFISCIRRRPAL